MKSVKKNYLWTILHAVVNVLLPLVVTPYLARALGADSIGINGYVRSIAGYFTVFAVLGTTIYGQRQIAYCKDDKQALSKTFFEIFFLRVITSGFMLLLYFVSVVLLFNEYTSIFLVYSMALLNIMVDISWFFKGIERFKNISIITLIFRLVFTASLFVFIHKPDDLWLYVVLSASSTLITNLFFWLYLRKFIIWPGIVNPFRDIKSVLLLFLPTIASQLYVYIDKSMIKWIADSTYQIGCYEECDKLMRVAISMVEATSLVMLSRISFLKEHHDNDQIKAYLGKALIFCVLLTFPMAFGLIAISNVFVPVFWGSGFDYCLELLPIMAIMIPIISISNLLGYSCLIPLGKQRVYTVAIVCVLIINIPLNLALISFYGALGAVVASLVSESVGMLFLLAYCIGKGYFSFKHILVSAIKCLIGSLIMLVGVYFANALLGKTTILVLLAEIGLGVFLYAVSLLVLKETMFLSTIGTVATSIKRILNKKTDCSF